MIDLDNIEFPPPPRLSWHEGIALAFVLGVIACLIVLYLAILTELPVL